MKHSCLAVNPWVPAGIDNLVARERLYLVHLSLKWLCQLLQLLPKLARDHRIDLMMVSKTSVKPDRLKKNALQRHSSMAHFIIDDVIFFLFAFNLQFLMMDPLGI